MDKTRLKRAASLPLLIFAGYLLMRLWIYFRTGFLPILKTLDQLGVGPWTRGLAVLFLIFLFFSSVFLACKWMFEEDKTRPKGIPKLDSKRHSREGDNHEKRE